MPSYDVRELTAIFAGGAVGGIARTALSNSLAPPAGHWPWVTFAINVSGAFLLGGTSHTRNNHGFSKIHLSGP